MQKIILTSTLAFAITLTAFAQSWINIGEPLSGSINALSPHLNKLFIGGNFKLQNRNECDFTAFYDGANVVPHVQPGLTGSFGITNFYTTSVNSPAGITELYALGDIANGTDPLAAGNCINWGTLNNKWTNATFKTPVRATAMAAGTIGIGSVRLSLQFVGMGASSALNYVAYRTNTSGWRPMGSGFNNKVNCLAIFNGVLYAGGNFTASGSTLVNHFAKWDPVNQVWLGVEGGCNGNVRCLKVYNGALYIGGDFMSANGVLDTRLLAKYDGSLFSSVRGGVPLGNSVRVITEMANSLYIAGDFTKVGSVLTKNIAEITTAAPYWTAYSIGVTAPVNALAYYNGELYMGQESAGAADNYLKKWGVAVVATTNIATETAKMSVFPNPTTDQITVKTVENIKNATIYSLSGVLVATQGEINSTSHTISLQDLPKGVYLLQITMQNGQKQLGKVVKW